MVSPFLIPRTIHREENGSVTVFEEGTVPFPVRRAFWVSASDRQSRGSHAHRECWQVLFATSGEIDVETKSSNGTESFRLNVDSSGLVIPPLTWAEQMYLGTDSTLLVICSHIYSERDYIRNFSEFLAIVQRLH